MTLAAHHIPASLTPFIGRKSDLAEIARLLNGADSRLVTLVGPGGIGKTRLAQEAARQLLPQFSDGVYFVGLQAISSPDFIIFAIANALDYEINHCCDLRDQLVEFLHLHNLLLVLDNFEHLLPGVDIVSDLLAGAPQVKVLATSRERLNIQGEWVLPVAGLPFPVTADSEPDLTGYCALALFEQSARRVRADFSLEDEWAGAVRICSLVEGMPLAIEFAATWVNTLACDEIAAEIQRNLNFLEARQHGFEQRHASMRAVLDYSWKLLSPDEQDILIKLSVFRGSFTRQAAADVAGAALADLSSLIDKSLVRRDDTGRYDMHELVRQYAERHLNDDMERSMAARTRHVYHYTSLLQSVQADLFGGHPQRAMRAIEREIKNIRVAWGWAAILVLPDEIEQGLESLWFFYDTRGWYREGEKMLDLAADALREDPAQRQLFGKLVTRQGVLSSSLNWFEPAAAQLDEGLAIAREFGEPVELAFALVRRGTLAVFQGIIEDAVQPMEEALHIYNAITDPWNKAYALNWLGLLHWRRDYVEQSDTLFRELNSQWGIAVLTTSRAWIALSDEHFDTARDLANKGIVACQEIGIRWGVSMSYEVLGFLDLALDAHQDALRAFREMLRIALEAQLPRYMAAAAAGIGRALAGLAENPLALDFLSAAYRYYASLGHTPAYIGLEPDILGTLFDAATAQSQSVADPVAAIKTLVETLDTFMQTLDTVSAPDTGTDLLTEREVEVLARVGDGLSNREIADELFLSVGTVKWYLSQIYSKIGVSSRTQALVRARELGLLN